MFAITCEFDFDQEYYVFESEGDAMKWLDIEAGGEYTYDGLWADGLVSLRKVELIKETKGDI